MEDDVVQTGAGLVHQRVSFVGPTGQLLGVLHPEEYEFAHVEFDDVRILGRLDYADRPVVFGGRDRSFREEMKEGFYLRRTLKIRLVRTSKRHTHLNSSADWLIVLIM